MSTSILRSFCFLSHGEPSGIFPLPPDCEDMEITISPQDVQGGLVRITLSAHAKAMTSSWTRIAKHDAPLPGYATWHVVGGSGSESLRKQWPRVDSVKIAYSETGLAKIECDGKFADLMRSIRPERSLLADADKWVTAGDSVFQLRLDAWKHVLRILRGPGRSLRRGAEVDILIQGLLPLSMNNVDLSGIRILNLRRLDVNIRTDIAARCSDELLERVGIRFSLASMMAAADCVSAVEPETLIQVGFDPEIGCASIRTGTPLSRQTILHIDPATRHHSAAPVGLLRP